MAKCLFAPGIEEVSGALSKINLKSRHVDDQNMLLATHRKAATAKRSCQRLYMRKANRLPWQNTGIISQHTLDLRADFMRGVNAIKARKATLMVITLDQQKFLSLKPYVINAGYSPTMNVFYWAGVKKYRDESGHVQWPENTAIDLTPEEFLSACVEASK